MGPGLKSFKEIFIRYNQNTSLFNDSCKHFKKDNKKYFKIEFDILYQNKEEKNLDKIS